MPNMIIVDSTNIEAIGYDEAAEELHVRFLGGGLYIYNGVPQSVFDDFIAAPSKGSFLNREIRGVYSWSKQ